MKSVIQVSIRELHARTGHYIRKASGSHRVIVTDNGRPVAEIHPLQVDKTKPYFARRLFHTEFKRLSESVAFRPAAVDVDITELVSQDRS